MEEADGADRTSAGDGHVRHDRVIPRRVFDGRDDAQVDAAGVERVRHPRGDVPDDLEPWIGLQAVDQRDGVEIGDDAEPQDLTTP
jgi:hypothetical protein